jgi:hypothetical protein
MCRYAFRLLRLESARQAVSRHRCGRETAVLGVGAGSGSGCHLAPKSCHHRQFFGAAVFLGRQLSIRVGSFRHGDAVPSCVWLDGATITRMVAGVVADMPLRITSTVALTPTGSAHVPRRL